MMTRRSLWIFSLLCAVLLAGGVRAARAEDDGVNRAGLVIRYADGTVQTQCVSFSEASITGEELLQRSGLSVTMDYNAGLGGAVCSINGQGCIFPLQDQDCFCRSRGASGEYWAYFHRTATGWDYSSVGASSYAVTDSAMEGWSWGPGNSEPPALTFADVCPAAATITPTPTMTATATASPTPTATPTSEQYSVSLPLVSFEVNSGNLTAGECTTLYWHTSNATAVYLDNELVAAQDQRQVCLSLTQRFVLRAVNAAGQTSRELTVYVSQSVATATCTPTVTLQSGATATPTPTMTLQSSVTATPTPTAVIHPGTPTPTWSVATATTSPAENVLLRAGKSAASLSVVHAQEITPMPPSPAQAVAAPNVLFEFAPATATPRPRRALGSDGRPTPTPILQAYASAGDHPLAARSVDEGQASGMTSATGRSFTLALLPGYAAYLLTLAALAGVGARVTWRRSGEKRQEPRGTES